MEITFQDYFSIALGCAAGVLVLLTIVTLFAWSCRKKGRKEAREEFPLHAMDMPGYQGLMTSHSWQGGEPQPMTHVPPLQVGLDRPSHGYHCQPEDTRGPPIMPPSEHRSPQQPREGRERQGSNGRPRQAGDDDKQRGRRPRSRERRTRPHEEPDIVLASRAKSLERPSSLFRPINDRNNRRLPDPPTAPSGGAPAGHDMRRAFSDRTLDDPSGYRGNETPVSWQERFMAWKVSQQQLGPPGPPPLDPRDSRRRGQRLPEYLAGLPADDERRLNAIS
ncbi:uncharacterized protein LOC135498982 [Lineus longissimus]|uniref:uncharacterized protein LOC135498982 n=1 Tax=Lineus longissimus TaxID=88925 RepID=UPI002B4F88B6